MSPKESEKGLPHEEACRDLSYLSYNKKCNNFNYEHNDYFNRDFKKEKPRLSLIILK